MKLRFKYTGYFVSTFIFISLLVLVIAISMLSIDKRYFSKKYFYHSTFNDAIGLSNGTPILLKGFKIGQITDFSLNKENLVDVEIAFYKEFKDKILFNSIINKTVNPITATASIEFIPGENSSNLLAENNFIPSTDTKLGRDLLIAKGLRFNSSEKLSLIVDNLNNMLSIFSSIDTNSQGSIFNSISQISKITGSLQELIEKTNKTLVILNGDGVSQGHLVKSFENFSKVSGEMLKTTLMMNKTLTETDTFLSAYKNPEGLLGKMIDPNGDKIFNPATQTLNRLNILLTEHSNFANYLNSQTAEFSIILKRTQLMLSELEKTIEGLNNNPLIRGGIHKDEKPDYKVIYPKSILMEK